MSEFDWLIEWVRSLIGWLSELVSKWSSTDQILKPDKKMDYAAWA